MTMYMHRIYAKVCLICTLIILTNGQPYATVKALYNHLTTNNYSYIRPQSDLSTPTRIQVSFYLVNLQDLDGSEGKISVTGFWSISWTDQNLTWSLTDYNVQSIRIPKEFLWTPHFIIANPYSDGKVLSLKDSTVKVHSDGTAEWFPADNYQMACDADVSYYPYDKQTCEIWMLPWQYSSSQINITLPMTTVDLSNYNQNPTWDFVKSSVFTNTATNAVHVQMTFKRRPTFFMLNFILPIIILGVLNLFVFVLPADSGERVGFSITLLLSIAVYMTIVSDFLPSTTTPRMSSVSIKLCIDLIISTLIAVATVLGLIIHHRSDETPIKGMWKSLLNLKHCCQKRKSQVGDDHDKANDEKNNNQLEKENWKEVNTVVDKIFIILFSTILFVSNLAFFMDIVVGITE